MIDRRTFVRFAAVGGLSLATPNPILAQAMSPGGRIPAEFEPAKAVWLGQIPDDEETLEVSARIANALAGHVALKYLGKSAEDNARAKTRLASKGVEVEKIAFYEDPNAPYFVRDYFLFATTAEGNSAIVDFQWNTYGLAEWCRTHLAPDDAKRAVACAAFANPADGTVDQAVARLVGAELVPSPIFAEATGSFEVNGRGVLLMSEPLARQRNPQLSRDGIEAALLKLPGIRKVIWLAEGLAEDVHMSATIQGDYVGWGTGGHTDEFVRFADPRTILLAWVDDGSDHPLDAINRRRMARNLQILSAATDQDGKPFEIVKLLLPRTVEREVVIVEQAESAFDWPVEVFPAAERRRVGDTVIHVGASSYLNYIVANDIVLLPSYVKHGTPQALEDEVYRIMERVFPGRSIAFIEATRLNWVGGGIHCATNNEPVF